MEKKIDKIIVDGTGEMRQLRNTRCADARQRRHRRTHKVSLAYWREICLRWSAGLAAAKPLNTESWHTPERVIGTTGCMEKEQ